MYWRTKISFNFMEIWKTLRSLISKNVREKHTEKYNFFRDYSFKKPSTRHITRKRKHVYLFEEINT